MMPRNVDYLHNALSHIIKASLNNGTDQYLN